MAVISMKQLLEAGVHFGHQTRRWNPKMAQYIFTERNGIYIIDLQKTVRKIDEAYAFVRSIAMEGRACCSSAPRSRRRSPLRPRPKRCGMFYVNNRWLGGTLTNFRTIQDPYRAPERHRRDGRARRVRSAAEEGSHQAAEREKLLENLGGIREMKNLPGCLFVVDPRKEIAVSRRARAGHSRSSPSSIPTAIRTRLIMSSGNDDAIRAVKLIAGKMADAVLEGKQGEQAEPAAEAK